MKKPVKWTKDLLVIHFGLSQVFDMPLLLDWLDVQEKPSEAEMKALEELRLTLLHNVIDWSEEDLKMKFIALLMHLVEYDTDKYKTYWDREIWAKIDGKLVKSKIDFMLARGVGGTPQVPYFFFKEYKKELRGANDPLGQLLAAMLAAQHINNNRKPLYGAYIVGRNWFFVVLYENNYSVSDAFVATHAEDLPRILMILKKMKSIIREQLDQ